jgi:hypothetical protein
MAPRPEMFGNGPIGGEKALGVCPADLNRCMRRSRWRVGWCEFSARLFR